MSEFDPDPTLPPAPIMTLDLVEENYAFNQHCPGLPVSVLSEIYTQILLALKENQVVYLKELMALPNFSSYGFEPVRAALNDPVNGQIRANAVVQGTRTIGLMIFFKVHEQGWFLEGEFPYFPMRVFADKVFLRPDNPAIDAFRQRGWPLRR